MGCHGGYCRGLVLTHECREVPLLLLAVLFKLLGAAIVRLDLLPENAVLHLGGLIIKVDAPDSVQTLDRIIDVFPPHQQEQVRVQLANSLVAVVSQQLLPVPGQDGRVAAVEVLIANHAVRKVIRTHKHEQLYTIMQTSTDAGMITMDKALKNLYEQALIGYEDAKNRARFPDSFDKI